MIAVIFEFRPAPEGRDEYMQIAASLGAHLNTIDGFVSIERFQSLTDPGKVLSLTFWRDDEAVARWRAMPQHRNAQSRGRDALFEEYRLRVASVVRDYGLHDRAQAPGESREAHGT